MDEKQEIEFYTTHLIMRLHYHVISFLHVLSEHLPISASGWFDIVLCLGTSHGPKIFKDCLSLDFVQEQVILHLFFTNIDTNYAVTPW